MHKIQKGNYKCTYISYFKAFFIANKYLCHYNQIKSVFSAAPVLRFFSMMRRAVFPSLSVGINASAENGNPHFRPISLKWGFY